MPDALLENLQREFESRRSLISNVTQAAAEQGRELSPQDLTTIGEAKERMKVCASQIEVLSEQIELSEQSQRALARSNQPTAPEGEHYRSVGEVIHDRLNANQDHNARERYQRAMTRAAQHMGTTAANTVATAGGMPGLIIKQNVGPVIDLSPQGRPLLAALGVQSSISPISFQRPRIVDADFATGAAVQTKEKEELASKKFDVNADNVNLSTIGGYLNISAQLQALPIGALDISYNQLRRRVENATERAAVTSLLLNADVSVTLALAAAAKDFLAAVYDASAVVYAQTGRLATFIAMGPQGWARVGKFVDGDDRPYFPTLGATNAAGTASAAQFGGGSIAGLQPIVTHGMAGADAGTFVVGNEMALEAYEYRFPLFQSQEPSVLGTQIAVAVAFGTFRPVNGAAVAIKPVPAGAARAASADKKD